MPAALITGASSGLGLHFARELAAKGYRLILVARRTAPMEVLGRDLVERYGVKIRIIGMDLSESDAPGRLFGQLRDAGIDIDLLVNNAGFGTHGAFAEMDEKAIAGMIDLNVRSLTLLCREALPGMIARRQGAILNVASVAGFVPGPWLATYYASKAYVLSLSEALHEEARSHGVTVTALCPGPTRTEFAAIAGMAQSPLFIGAADPARVVRAALRAIRWRRAIAMPGITKAMPLLLRISPRVITRKIVGIAQRSR